MPGPGNDVVDYLRDFGGIGNVDLGDGDDKIFMGAIGIPASGAFGYINGGNGYDEMYLDWSSLSSPPVSAYAERDFEFVSLKGAQTGTTFGANDTDQVLYAQGYGGEDRFSGSWGDDRLFGGGRTDYLFGGKGKDWLKGEDGDDVFTVQSGDLAAGEIYDGGAGYDEIQFGVGAFDLRNVSLISIELLRSLGSSTTLTVRDEVQALTVSMAGAADKVIIGRWTGGNYDFADLVELIANRGVEQVEWKKGAIDVQAIRNPSTFMFEITQSDTLDKYVFTSIVEYYKNFGGVGVLNKRVQVDDDGAVTTSNYDAFGVITDKTIDASSAGRSYIEITETYVSGKLATSTTESLEITTEKTYDTSGPASVLKTSVRTDKAGGAEYTWNTITETYDAAGKLTQRTTVNDNGTEAVATYNAGVIASVVTTDKSAGGLGASYVSIVKTYDGNGKLASKTQVNDNGIEVVTTYNAGVIASAVTTDLLDAFTYESIETLYDSAGKLVLKTQINDNGTQTVTGGAGDNIIAGGTFADTLFGGAGADDFVFGLGIGADRVRDFNAAIDRLDLTAWGIDTEAELTALATVTEAATFMTINLGGGNTIRLDNIGLDGLSDANFVPEPAVG